MFGAHFDAWSDGAYDPAGATSIILEIAKTLSSIIASNGMLFAAFFKINMKILLMLSIRIS